MCGVQSYVCTASSFLFGEDFADSKDMAAMKIIDAKAFNRKLVRDCKSPRIDDPWYFQVDSKGRLYLGKCDGGSYEDLWEGKKRNIREGRTPMRYDTWYDISDMTVTAMKMEGIISFEPVHDAVRSFIENGRIKRLVRLGKKLAEEGIGSSV